ncbi:hypothetical protein OBBRIDRAFT_833268 [Obba rivulosa]|uniref:C3H1-type domain-containing protein n=1 Tax=Obba rivulosa TaxID=1052685 RepID=A0A8E2DLJ3_9APHY|nr:hypothetical protein OBBRIDRAFT_833268 [Obba rivulosa]
MFNDTALHFAVNSALHTLGHDPSQESAWRTRAPCTFYRAGFCQNGSFCAFAHGEPSAASSSRLSPLPLPLPPASTQAYWAGTRHAIAPPRPVAAQAAPPPYANGYARPPHAPMAGPSVTRHARPLYLGTPFPTPAAPLGAPTPAFGSPAYGFPPVGRHPSRAPSRPREPERVHAPFRYKAEPCKFWEQRGICRKGTECSFIHQTAEEVDRRAAGAARKARDGSAAEEKQSRLVRLRNLPEGPLPTAEESEEGFRPIGWRVVSGGVKLGGTRDTCQKFMAGRCRKGAYCQYAHPGSSDIEDEVSFQEPSYSSLWEYLPPGFCSAVPLPMEPPEDPPCPVSAVPAIAQPHPRHSGRASTFGAAHEDVDESDDQIGAPDVDEDAGAMSPSLLVRPASTPPASSPRDEDAFPVRIHSFISP